MQRETIRDYTCARAKESKAETYLLPMQVTETENKLIQRCIFLKVSVTPSLHVLLFFFSLEKEKSFVGLGSTAGC